MGRTVGLREAVNLIWETVKITEEQGGSQESPYLFIVGAGISAPEILSANGIVQHCKEKVKELYKDNTVEFNSIEEKSKSLNINSAEYYSFWFGQAYKNKIHRQQYLKKIIKNARISTSNLLLAQILNSRKIASTVITPNFDNQLLKSLNLLGNYNVFSANNVLDNIALNRNSEEIQLMHVHGTYEFYDCCNLENEISRIARGQGIKSTAGTIEEFLKKQAPIVIGYSGWEDDVIMSKIKERLQYAALPYSIIWFCYTIKDYELLPTWLKESEDVFFVLPEQKCKNDKDEDIKEESVLPAEDVLAALITKFEFKAPNLFSNPIQYYIELIDGFLPENADVFPIKSWKRRLDHIEENLGIIDKKIIELDDAAARKDVIDISRILKDINFNFISIDDLEHIVEGNILPLLNNKNRIEDKSDLIVFLNVILELFLERAKDIKVEKMKKYLEKTFDFLVFNQEKLEKSNLIKMCDKLLEICKLSDECEELELIILGTKSETVGTEERIELQNEIIERGIIKIEDYRMARLILIAVNKQIEDSGKITEKQKVIMQSVIAVHGQNSKILELYYKGMITFFINDIETGMGIEELQKQIVEKKLSKELLLIAQWRQCEKEEDNRKRISLAIKAIENYESDDNTDCASCAAFACLLQHIIVGKLEENEVIQQKYIEEAIYFCERTEDCKFVPEIVVHALRFYIENIKSQYEQKDLCRKVSEICKKKRMYDDWAYLCTKYVSFLDEKEKTIYINENDTYRMFKEASEKVSDAINNYEKHNVYIAKELLIESSDIFDKIFADEYNPAALNICFMVRRGEIPEINIPVLEILNKITWLEGDAFLHINKALAYVQIGDWCSARKEVQDIDYQLDSALIWWNKEDVVGRLEKFTVILLLVLEKKLDNVICQELREELQKELKGEYFFEFCLNEMKLPISILDEINNIKESMYM